MKQLKRVSFVLVLLIMTCNGLTAQNILDKTLSLDVKKQRLDNVLEIISNKGNFYFSYNAAIVKRDSLVTLSVNNKSVEQILEALLKDNFEFKESGNYIIIRKKPITITLVTNKAVVEDRHYTVSGYVMDDNAGTMVQYASVYEKRLLASSLTDEQGYFKLRLKSSSKSAYLTVSKEFYEDTTVQILPKYNQQLTITIVPVDLAQNRIVISPEDYFSQDAIAKKDTTGPIDMQYKTDTGKVEKTGLGKFLLSSKQKFQSINLKKFFTTRPWQVSFVPGLSTHGFISSQVVNNFSLNVLGGYNGGVNGMEIGGLFNIDRKDVQYFQIGGLFNVVGGKVKGFQVGGITNTVLNDVHGFQVAGVNNFVKGKFTGFQVGGVYNHVTDSVRGFQVAGVANFAKKRVYGLQIAGVANISYKEMTGTQISGVINYTKRLKGVQIGLINIADTSEGYSIGLINIILKGYHKLSFFSNEVLNVNAAFKTGNSKLYSILQAGLHAGKADEKLYSFGYGLGTEIPLGKICTLNPELSSQYLYKGSWDYLNLLNKLQLNLNIKLGKYVSIFGGPAFNVYYTHQTVAIPGYQFKVPPAGYNTFSMGNRVTGWFGWNAGINFF